MTANHPTARVLSCTWKVTATCPHCRKILTWRRDVTQEEHDVLVAAATILARCPRHGEVGARVMWDLDRETYVEAPPAASVSEDSIARRFDAMLDAVKAAPMSLEAHADVCTAMVVAKRGVMADVRKAVSS